MNLLETLEQAINYQLTFGLDGEYNKIKRAASNVEKIADDYAIEFARWCFDNEHPKDYYIKALNEFKKENLNECSECGGSGYIEDSSIQYQSSYPCGECNYHKQNNY